VRLQRSDKDSASVPFLPLSRYRSLGVRVCDALGARLRSDRASFSGEWEAGGGVLRGEGANRGAMQGHALWPQI